MERWWDAVKKVIRLYKIIYPNKDELEESDSPKEQIQEELDNEIDDYYVFIKQEEVEFDKKRKYTELEKESRIRTARVFGFWCFNPGLGFKKIV